MQNASRKTKRGANPREDRLVKEDVVHGNGDDVRVAREVGGAGRSAQLHPLLPTHQRTSQRSASG
eukprot:1641507-Rhodomonas_salina.1